MVVKINLLGDSKFLSNISYFVSNDIKRKYQELPKGTSESPKMKIKILFRSIQNKAYLHTICLNMVNNINKTSWTYRYNMIFLHGFRARRFQQKVWWSIFCTSTQFTTLTTPILQGESLSNHDNHNKYLKFVPTITLNSLQINPVFKGFIFSP